MWKWILALIVLALFGFGLYTMQSLNGISFDRFELDSFSVDMAGVSFSGYMYVNNPTWITLDWDSTPYEIYLNGKHVGDGVLPASTLNPGSNAIPVSQDVSWDVSLSLLHEVILDDSAMLSLNGTQEMDVYGFTIDSPFHVEMDIKPQIEFYLRKQADQISALIPFDLISS